MDVSERDATNSVRLCDRCEGEYGVSAGADAGDRACAVCGASCAPHVYPQAGAVSAEREAPHSERTLRDATNAVSAQATREPSIGTIAFMPAERLAKAALEAADHPRGAVSAEREAPYCPQCGREDINRTAPCPTPGCLTFPWEAYQQATGTDHPRGAVDPDEALRRVRDYCAGMLAALHAEPHAFDLPTLEEALTDIAARATTDRGAV